VAANEYRGWTSSYRLCRHPIAAALPIATPIGIAIGIYLSTLAPQAVRGETVRGTAFFIATPVSAPAWSSTTRPRRSSHDRPTSARTTP
jgi:hypothetical protein